MGSIITRDSCGVLYRLTPPAISDGPGDTKIEKLSIDFSHCHTY
jgi:hypothetical protein